MATYTGLQFLWTRCRYASAVAALTSIVASNFTV